MSVQRFLIYSGLAMAVMIFTQTVTASNKEIDSLKKKLTISEGEEKIRAMIGLSYNYLRVDIDSSLKYAKSALNYSRITGNERGVARANLMLGNVYDEMGNASKALVNYLTSLRIFKKIKDTVAIGYVYNNLGIVYHNTGKYKKAIEQYENSIEVAKQTSDDFGLCFAMNNIGSVYEDWRKYEPALSYYKDALKLAEKIKDSTYIGIILQNIGVVYQKSGKYDEAINYLDKSLNVSNKIGDSKGVYNTLINEGKIFMTLNELTKATVSFKKAVAIASELGNGAKLAEAHLYLGKVYTGAGKMSEAGKNLTEAEKIAGSLEDATLKKDVYNALSDFYTKIKDYRNALDYYKKYIAVKDTIYNRDSRREITEMETKYELDKKEKEIVIKSLKIEKQQTRFYFIIASSLVLIIVSWLLFNRYKLRQKHFRMELEKKNIEIEQRLLRTQMNPHFIFNSLNSINSFITDNNPDSAQLFLSKFARLMRYILNNSRETMIPVEDEINTLQLYMELEQLRFDNKFDFKININDDIDTEYTFIPPMLIQPFVENAIIHGIGAKEEKGNIFVEIKKYDNIILCSVEDDGIGREKAMQKKKIAGTKKHKSLGMQVTKERLDILDEKYGNNISFTFIDKKTENGKAAGTRVEIRIPYEEE